MQPTSFLPSSGESASTPTEQPTETIALTVNGMRCAGCVRAVEQRLNQQPGVITAVVNLVTQTAMVEYQPGQIKPEQLATTLSQTGFPTQVQAQELLRAGDTEQERRELLTNLYQLGMAAVLVICSGLGHLGQIAGMALPDFHPGISFHSIGLHSIGFHWGLATLALLGPGRAILWEGAKGWWQGVPNMNTLVGLGTLSAYLASVVALLFPALNWECFFDEPVMMIGFILLGRTLEQQARGKAKSALRKLLSLQPSTARWLADGQRSVSIPIHQVQVGARLLVLPGDRIPVDGKVLVGQTLVDESMFSGEPLPIAKSAGDTVLGGSLNQSAAMTIAALHTGKDSALAQIIRLVETAQTRKAPVQRLADTVAGYFTYGVMAIALVTFLFWYGLGSHWFDLAALPQPVTEAPLLLSLKLAIAVLVVACPCALGLATPTAILVGTSLGAERGLLIRGADVLEQVHHLDTIVFDKTGTLTRGKPSVVEIWLADGAADAWTADRLLQLAASVETGGQHPLGLAIVQAAHQRELSLLTPQRAVTEAGLGVAAQVEEQWVCLGTAHWLAQQGIEIPAQEQLKADQLAAKGQTIVYVGVGGQLVGGMAIADPLHPQAKETIAALKAMGLQVKVLTGDQRQATIKVLQPLGLEPDCIWAEMRPADKVKAIAQLQAQGHRVAMVGDGINDAPALAQATVGMALASGTDVAVEAAQIVLMAGRNSEAQLTGVVAALKLSRQTFRKIQQNLFWALGYNLIGLPLAAGVLLPGWGVVLSPAMAGAMMAFSSVCVVINSLSLRWRWGSGRLQSSHIFQ